jgi:hypothetical protein
VNFGPNPSTTKICPETVPVAKGLGDLAFVQQIRKLESNNNTSTVLGIGTESSIQKQNVPCDTNLHPTGQPEDEVCPYSDCDEGGSHSAICACIDLSKYGLGDGMEWVCMHATCACNEETINESATIDEEENTEDMFEKSADINPSKFRWRYFFILSMLIGWSIGI